METVTHAARESTIEVFPWLPWCHSAHRVEEAREWVASRVEAYRKRTEFGFVIGSENSRFLGVFFTVDPTMRWSTPSSAPALRWRHLVLPKEAQADLAPR